MTAQSLPTGTVTFMFTDIEGSTRLVRDLGDDYRELLAAHDAAVRGAIAAEGGVEVRTEGDSFFAVFASAPAAAAAAAAIQQAVAADPVLRTHGVQVRIGLHTGEGARGGADYVGYDVHKASRVGDAGAGGQVLLSAATTALAADELPAGVELRDLGFHNLKDLAHPERLSQLVIDGLPADFPPLRSAGDVANNLPADLTSFVGREHEIAEARKLLERTRLLTLTGPGGVGKTRLSLRVAAAAMSEFRDGAFFVQLSAITKPELVPTAVLEAFGAPVPTGGRDPRELMLEYLGERSMLVVLDNMEQLREAAPIVADMLRVSPDSKIIVTSRAPLRIAGEQELEVPPLETADPTAETELLAATEAVSLFVARARAVRPSFTLDESNAADVAMLTARLDGLPLAIELAASRVKLLPPRAILENLEEIGLRGGRRDVEARQQTLEGAIAWSFDLLEDPYRRLFERLAVFSGGAGLAEIEAVCCGDEAVSVDVLDGVAELVDHSLVRQYERLGDSRFRMLQTIGDYAARKLRERGEWDAVATRHADVYGDLAERAEPHLTGHDAAPWLERLGIEHDNLRAVLDRAVAAGEADRACRVAACLWRFWHIRGHLYEARERMEQVLAIPGGSQDIRARALEGAGGVAYWQGDMAAAREFYGESLEIARSAGDRRAVAHARYNLAFTYMFADDVAEAGRLLEEAFATYTELDDPSGIANVTWGMGNVFQVLGEHEKSHEWFTRSAAAYERLGDPFGLGWSMFTLGETDVIRGRSAEAREHFERGIRIFSDSGDVSAVVMFLAGFAIAALRQGDRERAARLAGALSRLRERTGTDLVAVGSMTLKEGNAELAELERACPEDFAVGRGMTADQAVRYALGDD